MKIRMFSATMSVVLMFALILTACSGSSAPAASTTAETEISSETTETTESDQESTEAAASTLVSIGSYGIGSAVDGTAPACVTDLMAGIRMIKANAELMAGDINRIVATGTSAGGWEYLKSWPEHIRKPQKCLMTINHR